MTAAAAATPPSPCSSVSSISIDCSSSSSSSSSNSDKSSPSLQFSSPSPSSSSSSNMKATPRKRRLLPLTALPPPTLPTTLPTTFPTTSRITTSVVNAVGNKRDLFHFYNFIVIGFLIIFTVSNGIFMTSLLDVHLSSESAGSAVAEAASASASALSMTKSQFVLLRSLREEEMIIQQQEEEQGSGSGTAVDDANSHHNDNDNSYGGSSSSSSNRKSKRLELEKNVPHLLKALTVATESDNIDTNIVELSNVVRPNNNNIISNANANANVNPNNNNNNNKKKKKKNTNETITVSSSQNEQQKITINDKANKKNTITLVTQGDVSRFQRLLFLLKRWEGPISCAMHITSFDELYQFYTLVQEQQQQGHNDLFQQYVSIHLLFESPHSEYDESSGARYNFYYPINRLRNLALRNAKEQSDYVFLNDIDFQPTLHAHSSIQSMIEELPPKTFWILPAFERFDSTLPTNATAATTTTPTTTKNDHDDEQEQTVAIINDDNDIHSIPENKASLYDAIQREEVAPFHAYLPAGHGYTNYAKWYTASSIYSVDYGYSFEPYAIVRSKDLHDFYPRYRGYGRNKWSFYLEAHYRNYTFQVLPDHFVVHMNHGFQDGRTFENDGNSDIEFPRFQQHLKEQYGVPISASSEEQLIKTQYRHRGNDGDKFPCHYLTRRNNVEFDIQPNFNGPKYVNTSIKWLPTSPESEYDITVVTMMHPSDGMFSRLKHMANHWSGQISVAIFIPSNEVDGDGDAEERSGWPFFSSWSSSKKTLSLKAEAESKIRKFQADNFDKYGYRISFHLVTDLVPKRGKDRNVFPRNLLRNVALDNAHTSYVLVLDIDLVPSANAHEQLTKNLQSLHKSSSPSTPYALVVPAFERSSKFGGNYNMSDITSAKSRLLEIRNENPQACDVFLKKAKYQAHNATNYDKWYNTNNGEIYSIDYEVDYEPYVVVKRDGNLPPFWEHFTGFGRNKLEWIEELHLSGTKFVVAPDTFVVHKSHKKYGLRKVRPFIVDEYSWRFQEYMQYKYGRSTQDMKEVAAWGSTTFKKWEKIDDKDKTEHVSWEHMLEAAEVREKEFQTCMEVMKKRAA